MKTAHKKNTCKMRTKRKQGSALGLMVIFMVILMVLGNGMLTVAYGVRLNAIRLANRAIAMSAAESGYEEAVAWMMQQLDVADEIDTNGNRLKTLQFTNSSCDTEISFFTFFGTRTVCKIKSIGYCGRFSKTVEALVLQSMSGWESSHMVPAGPTSAVAWPFADSEVIDIPLHINNHNDSPDEIDINIQGSPSFLQKVSFGESRYRDDGTDKYPESIIELFQKGVYFDQPDSKIDQADAVELKMEIFEDLTDSSFKFTPTDNTPAGEIENPHAAVQLEFRVEGGVGQVRITNNCTVRGYQNANTHDYKINTSGGADDYERYDIYAYHVKPHDQPTEWIPIKNTYVTRTISGIESGAGGQIYVDGNVIIGGEYDYQLIKDKLTVAATGNIWIADSIMVDGDRDGDMPAADNTNILGLFSQGVIKVVDPGMSENHANLASLEDEPVTPEHYDYAPIGLQDPGHWTGDWWNRTWVPAEAYERRLPSSSSGLEIEAAMTIGGGGWGAENVGQRKTNLHDPESSWSGTNYGDYVKLVVRGAISEASRGIVGTAAGLSFPDSSNGFYKRYYYDKRLLMGLLPGDLGMQSKYLLAPGGWKDY